LRLRLERWAAAPDLLFIEWTITGEIAGRPLVLPNADRFTLREMLASEGAAYFDDLAVRLGTRDWRDSRLSPSRMCGQITVNDPRER